MLAKRVFDVLVALIILTITLPVLLLSALAVFMQDGHFPLYFAARIGKGGKAFRMVKLRSMTINADKAGVDVVGAGDQRVTPLGWWLRRCKLDELPQLWNVLVGDMSIVGPRPDTPGHIAVMSPQEYHILDVRPGMTDLSSIVFSKQELLFADSTNTEADYLVRMRPLKMALGVWYTRHATLLMDIAICCLTAIMFVDYARSLRGVYILLRHYHAPAALLEAVADMKQSKWHTRSLSEFGIE